MKLPRRKREEGFTLIELLVVVAIIAILAALLLPALQNAKAQGKRALCVGNLHNLALICIAYAGDYSGWLPIADSTRLGYTPNTRWRTTEWYPFDLNYPLGPMLLSMASNSKKLFFCLGNRTSPADAVNIEWLDCCVYDPNYFYYAYLGPEYGNSPGHFPLSPGKMSDSPNCLLWGDIAWVWFVNGPEQVVQGPGSYLWANHVNNAAAVVGSNWARLDGSVTWFPKSQLQLSPFLNPVPALGQHYIPAYVYQ